MEAALQQATSGSQPPLVVTPPGYWVDGTDHRHALDSAGRALLPAQPAWQPRIDQDDTAKCYRRFFVGRVTYIYITCIILNIGYLSPFRQFRSVVEVKNEKETKITHVSRTHVDVNLWGIGFNTGKDTTGLSSLKLGRKVSRLKYGGEAGEGRGEGGMLLAFFLREHVVVANSTIHTHAAVDGKVSR